MSRVPDGWSEGVVSDFIDVNPRRSIPKDMIVPFVEMAAVEPESPSICFLSERLASSSGAKFRDGDTLFARITPCAENGKGAYVQGVGDYAQGSTEFIVLAPKRGVDGKYTYYLSKSAAVHGYAIAKMEGTSGRQRVPNRVFDEISVALPPLPEQKKIAAILSSVDDAIAATQAAIDQTRKVKEGLLQDLIIQDSCARSVLLDEVATRKTGHTPKKQHDEYWNGGVKWISLQDSKNLDKVYISETAVEISDAGLANSSAVLLPENTVVLSRDAGVGKSAIMNEPMAVSQHFVAWICGDRLDYHYLYYWLQKMKPVFESVAMGSTIKTIGMPFFKKMKISLPSMSKQVEAARLLLATDMAIAKHEGIILKLRDVKRGLMQDLLSGSVRVTTP
ncbi:restriction endonuclease subunit S [Desulfovibrio psychrotolerans]|uniref:Type I restriction modification DNA specificity domain-containing protein n=1 Tax=Desulfovibrio psychrotolerans TaxID=415242 RepID=A0A7J0BQH1_9BACT|nr:restriction endonuclease subunit S [Desulfovibrio psychrotolerans]GFM35966.1 hypothetical protein DSM19430T_06500 [Desulfovibrio psychrotolerans]